MSCASYGSGAVMTKVLFASFGRPFGLCPNGFLYNSACHASTTMAVVNASCVGLAACSIVVDSVATGEKFLGRSDTHLNLRGASFTCAFRRADPCVGLGKFLAVVAVCGNVTGSCA